MGPLWGVPGFCCRAVSLFARDCEAASPSWPLSWRVALGLPYRLVAYSIFYRPRRGEFCSPAEASMEDQVPLLARLDPGPSRRPFDVAGHRLSLFAAGRIRSIPDRRRRRLRARPRPTPRLEDRVAARRGSRQTRRLRYFAEASRPMSPLVLSRSPVAAERPCQPGGGRLIFRFRAASVCAAAEPACPVDRRAA